MLSNRWLTRLSTARCLAAVGWLTMGAVASSCGKPVLGELPVARALAFTGLDRVAPVSDFHVTANAGSTWPLRVVEVDGGGRPVGEPVNADWYSSDPGVVAVTVVGTIAQFRAVAPGHAIVMASVVTASGARLSNSFEVVVVASA